MRLMLPDTFQTQPWKNGGGITHEIARADRGSQILWRLSIAEVASDGPFSAFPGLSRILTVIDGAGLYLDTATGRLDAVPLAPLAFSGDLPVTSRLIDGPIRDFNLIWDATRLAASVRLIPTSLTECPPAPGRFYAFLALSATPALDMPQGAVAFFDLFTPIIPTEAHGLLVTLEHLP